MSPLRRQMEADMVVRGLALRTRETYVEWVARFAKFHGKCPDRLGEEEVSLSGILCVRHTMSSERNMYAEASEEDAEGQRCCASGGVAQDPAGVA